MRLMARMKLPRKLVILAALFIVPLVAALYATLAVAWHAYATTQGERDGISILETTQDLLKAVQVRRGAGASVLAGNEAMRAKFDAASASAGRLAATLKQQVRGTDRFDIVAAMDALASEYGKAAAGGLGTSAAALFGSHTDVIHAIFLFEKDLAVASRLGVDPDASNYHLIDSVLFVLPGTAETVGVLRGKGAAALVGGALGAADHRARMQALMRTAGMLPVLVLLCVGFGFMTDGFFTLQNLSIVTQQASINIVLAAGMTFVILTGGIDLSVGSVLAAAAVASLLASNLPGWGWLGIPAALAVGLAFGVVNGGLISFLRLPPFIVTLGALTAVRGIARLMGNDTTIFNPQLPFAFIGNGSILGVPWLVVIALAVVAVSWFILRRTVLGMRIYAVGGNPEAARLSGINVRGIELFVYASSGLLAGLGALMSAARLYAANGLQLGQSYELDAIAAVILGGTSFVGGVGSIVGTLVGALIIAVLSNGLVLLGVSDIWQYIIKGLVIIGAVALDRYRQHGSART